VTIRAWSSSPARTFRWTATAGTLSPSGSTALWSLANLPDGAYAAYVQPAAGGERCRVRVILSVTGGKRRGVARSLLVGNASEDLSDRQKVQYGLYSYLLLPAMPGPASQERYESALRAYFDAIVDVDRLVDYLEARDLNVTFVPVTKPFAEDALADPVAWALKTYNYARAQAMLRRVPGAASSDGPFLVSCTEPLSRCSRQIIVQDLSSVPPHLVRLWVREFLNHAVQEEYRGKGEDGLISLGLRMRTTISVLAAALGPVTKAVVEIKSILE
jgi:hypothetical protein